MPGPPQQTLTSTLDTIHVELQIVEGVVDYQNTTSCLQADELNHMRDTWRKTTLVNTAQAAEKVLLK